ncbi:hypothetical protein HMPREF3196_01906 [Bifidobacterium bifidum]|uniref:Uncharacterized protein n=1 Tax=Bifidobacterium bifidum TaxID=1681 RepID=A0A133KKY3_BIFBI|nr:hypothetical protein HMPREF3196_01906 [Bifidobacterium bifidum]
MYQITNADPDDDRHDRRGPLRARPAQPVRLPPARNNSPAIHMETWYAGNGTLRYI